MKLAALRTGALAAGILAAAICLYSQTAPAKEEHPDESLGVGPRATPGEYPAHAQAGSVTIGAEYDGHYVPTPEGTLTTEDYVSVEVGLFGPAGAKANLSPSDFSLRVNGKKPLPAQSAVVVATNVKDPAWEADQPAPDKSSKTGINTGGGGGANDTGPPPAPKMPPALVHALTLHVLKAAVPEGERSLPQGGLLFFEYRGKAKGIHSVELLYKGSAGEATIALHP